MTISQTNLPPVAKASQKQAIPAAPAIPAAVNIPAITAEHKTTDLKVNPAARLGSLVVADVETKLANGVVIPTKTDMATKPVKELNETLASGQAALTRQLEASRDALPNLGFSGGAGQNIDSIFAERGGRDGAVWAAGMRQKGGTPASYARDLVNSAQDASGYVSFDPSAHKSTSHTLGGVIVLNLDHAPNKGSAPARNLAQISASKYPGGECAERMQVTLEGQNFDSAVVGVVSWDKSPKSLSHRPAPSDKERIEIVQKFRALYAASSAVQMATEGPAVKA